MILFSSKQYIFSLIFLIIWIFKDQNTNSNNSTQIILKTKKCPQTTQESNSDIWFKRPFLLCQRHLAIFSLSTRPHQLSVQPARTDWSFKTRSSPMCVCSPTYESTPQMAESWTFKYWRCFVSGPGICKYKSFWPTN
jgi:hypothetical protein